MRSKSQPNLPRRQLTAFEMQRRPAAFQRQALQEPVTITQHGAPTIVAMSVAEYQRLKAGNQPDRKAEDAYAPVMDRQDAIQRIHAHRHELEALGAAHVTLFGSIARDEATADSDVDVIVDSVDGQALGLFKLGALKEQFEYIFGREVDVISRRGLNNSTKMKQRVAADMLDVF